MNGRNQATTASDPPLKARSSAGGATRHHGEVGHCLARLLVAPADGDVLNESETWSFPSIGILGIVPSTLGHFGSTVGWRYTATPDGVAGGNVQIVHRRPGRPFEFVASRLTVAASIATPLARPYGVVIAQRYYRPAMLGLALLFVVVAAAVFVVRWRAFEAAGFLGVDYDLVPITARRFLETGSMYFPYQLTGPYVLQPAPYTADIMPAIYPPHAIYLFAPFLVLPSFLWWAIPLGVTAFVVLSFRPAPWAWPLMAGLFVLPETVSPIIVGNTTMWLVAFVAAGLRWHWPAVLITLKPSLLPFALIGARRSSWKIAAAVVAIVALPMLPLWLDYARAVQNAGASPLYSLGSVPAMLIPVLAWVASRRPRLSRPALAPEVQVAQ